MNDHPIRPEDFTCQSCTRPYHQHVCTGGFSRRRYPFAGMLRIRNESRWIAEVLESIRPLCQHVFILDDHSTDNTVEIVQRFGSLITLFYSPFHGLNESRDKNWLLTQILQHGEPDWILCIDGDEVLERRGPEYIRQTTDYVQSGCQCLSLKIEYMWDNRDQVRVDRIYGDFWRPSLFKPFIPRLGVPDDSKLAEEFSFMSTPFGHVTDGHNPNLHCSSVPQRVLHGRKLCPARLKHYGYMDRADRIRKLDYYTSIDWSDHAEDCYRHMVQGDGVKAEELPLARGLVERGTIAQPEFESLLHVDPNVRLVHAGPLELKPWNESAPWAVSEWAKQNHQ